VWWVVEVVWVNGAPESKIICDEIDSAWTYPRYPRWLGKGLTCAERTLRLNILCRLDQDVARGSTVAHLNLRPSRSYLLTSLACLQVT
jgi:hypothetical protein